MTPAPIRILVGICYLLMAAYYTLGLLWFGFQLQPIIISIPMLLVIVSLLVGAFFPYGSANNMKLSLVALSIGILGVLAFLILMLNWNIEGGDQESYIGYFIATIGLLVVFVFRVYDDYKRLAQK